MANPSSPTEGGGLAVDFIADTSGNARFKLAVGSNTIAGATNPGGYAGVATAQQMQSSFANGQPVVTGAGVDSANVVRAHVADTDGVLAVRPRGLGGSVANTEVAVSSKVNKVLPTATLSGRSRLVVQADPANTVAVYVGDSSVSLATGISLTSNSQPLPLDAGSNTVYGIAAGTARVRVLELS